jgi:hypothetical protein
MNFFFVQDHRGRSCFLSSEPLQPLQVKVSKSREVWEAAKKKVTGLNPRMLLQEQAFERAGRPEINPVRIACSERLDEKKARSRFTFFLHRQRTRHMAVLSGEALLLPVSGLAAILPGPNIFFYFLAVLMVIQWQATRGITHLLRKEHEFVPSPLLASWETAVESGDTSRYAEILDTIEKTCGLPRARRILWK